MFVVMIASSPPSLCPTGVRYVISNSRAPQASQSSHDVTQITVWTEPCARTCRSLWLHPGLKRLLGKHFVFVKVVKDLARHFVRVAPSDGL
jgi:hypothetical protein